MKRNKLDVPGFTLIELLVVVLIIGILTAIALPQYNKAVNKARYTRMLTAAKQLHDAQQRYILAKGEGTYSFEALDVNFPGEIVESSWAMSKMDMGDFWLIIQNKSSWATLKQNTNRSLVFFWYPSFLTLTPDGQYATPETRTYLPADTPFCYVQGESVWNRADWCSQTFKTNPSTDWATPSNTGAALSGHLLRIPQF